MNDEMKLGITVFCFSVFLWFYAIPYHIKGSAQAMFPKSLAVSMMIPCALFFIQGIKKYKTNREQQVPILFNRTSLKSLRVVPLMLVYIFLIPIIGFYVTTSMFVFLFMLFFGHRKWVSLSLYSIVFPTIVYVVIRKFLSFPFPEGIWF